jgi:hemerythrin-like domain-containing protein
MHSKTVPRVMDALDLVALEHDVIRRHFREFELSIKRSLHAECKATIVDRICFTCCLHLQVEEEILYPAARSVLPADALLEHALCDHAGSRELIARLDELEPQDADYDPTVAVLAAYLLPHMDEEQRELFPRLRNSPLDLHGVGRQLAARHKALLSDVTRIGLPPPSHLLRPANSGNSLRGP